MELSIFQIPIISNATTISITSASSSSWTLTSTTSTTKYNLIKTKKTVTSVKKYKGRTHNSNTYALTDNYKHTKGNEDLTASTSIEETYTFTASTTTGIKEFGATLGYSYSKSTSKTVSCALAKNKESGYYYYGVYAKYIDLKIVTTQNVYKKKNGSYVYSSSKTDTVKGTQLYTPNNQSALYYSWYKTK